MISTKHFGVNPQSRTVTALWPLAPSGAGPKRSRAPLAAALHMIAGALVLRLATVVTPNLSAAEVTVFAAASLTDCLKDIAAQYKTASRDRILFDFGASSLLARQIEEGAPADIFFSADEAKMDELASKGLILKETRKSPLSNQLVIIVAAEDGAPITNVQDLASNKIQRLALAEPKTVPAGIYAREYLVKRHLWAAVESKVVPTENVRAALAAVEAGNADAAIVYKTDARISKKVKVVYEVPAGDAPRISYSVAVLKAAKQAQAANEFLAYLNSGAATSVFLKFGFVVPRDIGPPGETPGSTAGQRPAATPK